MFATEYEIPEAPRQRGRRFFQEDTYRIVMPIIMTSSRPPWRPIASREVARLLNVSLQSLANWRVRDDGPEHEPFRKGDGNRVFYRPDKLLTFLDESCRGWWEWSAMWIRERGLWDGEASPESVGAVIDFFERAGIFAKS